MQYNNILEKQKKEKTACCCRWGSDCQEIGMAFLALPDGSPFNLYKKTQKAKKMANVLWCHLSMKKLIPVIFVIARHHFPIELLERHETKKRQWLLQLTLKQGIANDEINYHPDSRPEDNVYMLCQVPNNMKGKLLMLVQTFTLARGDHQKNQSGIPAKTHSIETMTALTRHGSDYAVVAPTAFMVFK